MIYISAAQAKVRASHKTWLLVGAAIAGVMMGAGAANAADEAAAALAPAPAATPAQASSDAQDASVSTVIVTGVRGGKPRTVAQSPAPINVIQANQIADTGRADLAESLSKLLPSINFGQTEAGIYSIVRPINNRGMGPAYTLVLVDGKRRHNSSLITDGGDDTSGVNPVDLDMIPASAIAYVEVLKDSAAAQYGSDAVAGVINIVLKNQNHGLHASVLGGSLYQGENDLSTYKGEVDAGAPLGQNGFIHFGVSRRSVPVVSWRGARLRERRLYLYVWRPEREPQPGSARRHRRPGRRYRPAVGRCEPHPRQRRRLYRRRFLSFEELVCRRRCSRRALRRWRRRHDRRQVQLAL